MSPPEQELQRTGEVIMKELLELTRRMAKQREDADFLAQSVEKRQTLMQEFDRLRETDPDSTSSALHPNLKVMAKEMIFLDGHLTTVLEGHLEEVRSQLKENTNQQKVMGYASNAISAAGSYMDFKK